LSCANRKRAIPAGWVGGIARLNFRPESCLGRRLQLCDGILRIGASLYATAGQTDDPRPTGGVPDRASLTSGPGRPGKAGFSSGVAMWGFSHRRGCEDILTSSDVKISSRNPRGGHGPQDDRGA
jgi:hypothetical protein